MTSVEQSEDCSAGGVYAVGLHPTDCPRIGDRSWKHCKRPKWIWGTAPDGEFVRLSAKTRSWEQAEEYRRQLESSFETTKTSALSPRTTAESSSAGLVLQGSTVPVLAPPITALGPPQKPRTSIEYAVAKYLADAKSRDLEKSTISKLETIFRKQFLVWANVEGHQYLDEIDLDAVKNFRATWTDGALSKSKKRDRLIGFFWSCVRRGYIAHNPALEMGKIKVVHVPTDYFPQDEIKKIIDATFVYGDSRGGFIPTEDLRARLRTMTLLMIWSGLRIRDAVTLERSRLHGHSLFLYQAKTGTPVYVPLPPHVVQALNELPPGSPAESPLLLLERQRQPKKCRSELAACLPAPLRTRRSQASRRHAQEVPPAHVPRYICCSESASRRANRPGFAAARARVDQDYREELCSLRKGKTAATPRKCPQRMEACRTSDDKYLILGGHSKPAIEDELKH